MVLNIIAVVVSTAIQAGIAETNPLESAVQCHEVAFSRSVEVQDIETFRSFLDADVRFVSGPPLRGPAAVVEGWQAFFEPDGMKIRWWPDSIEVRESGKLALSQGPYEMTITNEEGTTLRAGRFISVWQAKQDGSWKIIFDTGTAGQPIDEPLVSPWDDAEYAAKCSGKDS